MENNNILSQLTTYRCPECLLIQNIYLKTTLNIYLICPNLPIKSYYFNKDYITNKRIDLSNLNVLFVK